MVFTSSHVANVPCVDLLSFVFKDQDYDRGREIYIDALDDNRRLTRSQSESYVRKIISGLKARGVEKGDHVLVHSFSDIMYPVLYLGIIGAGAVFVGSNPGSTVPELVHLFTLTTIRYVLVAPNHLPQLLRATSTFASPIPHSNIFIFDTPHDPGNPMGFESWKSLLQYGEESWQQFNDGKASQETAASLYTTSGTTGLPKVAVLSHHASIARCILSNDPNPKSYKVSRLLCLPMFHCLALTASHIDPLRYGFPTYILPRLVLPSFLSSICKYRVTETSIVPTVLRSILQDESRTPDDLRRDLWSLRIVRSGGAPLSVDIQRAFSELLHFNARVINAWGLTEFGTITSFLSGEYDGTGSCGRLLTNAEVKILDPDGKEIIKDGLPGEVLVRGPSLLSHYLGDKQATDHAFIDGWLKTGDVAYCQQSRWYVVDRLKDMIKVRGWQVAPAELEAVLLLHAQVAEVSVVGMKTSEYESEYPRAFVVRKNVMNNAPIVTADELKEFLNSRLSKYKAIQGGVEFVDALPKTSTGKVLRRVLQQQAKDNRDM